MKDYKLIPTGSREHAEEIAKDHGGFVIEDRRAYAAVVSNDVVTQWRTHNNITKRERNAIEEKIGEQS